MAKILKINENIKILAVKRTIKKIMIDRLVNYVFKKKEKKETCVFLAKIKTLHCARPSNHYKINKTL